MSVNATKLNAQLWLKHATIQFSLHLIIHFSVYKQSLIHNKLKIPFTNFLTIFSLKFEQATDSILFSYAP